MGITRRDFLTRVGQAGGFSAAVVTMQALGLMPMKEVEAEQVKATTGAGVLLCAVCVIFPAS